MTLLVTSDLKKDFGGLHALQSLDLHVDEGEIVSLIGPNGAGKTTFFNVLSGLYPSDGGSILFNGHNLVGLAPNAITKLGIARTFQTVRLFPQMTILENVMVGQHSRTQAAACPLSGSVLSSKNAC